MKKAFCSLIISILILIFLSTCGSSWRFLGTGLCHAKHGLTIEEEKKLGEEFKNQLEKRLELIKDPAVQKYIDTIGQNILSQLEYKPFNFNFYVYVSSDPNAFAIPAGYIYISTGLITLTENESELAGVISHEIAHVTARHIAEKIEQGTKLSMGALAAILAGIFLGSGEIAEAVGAFSLATMETLALKYSRENEEEADRLGLRYLIKAGYDGSGIVNFLKKLKANRLEAFQLPSYLSTHPDVDMRIAYVDLMLERFPKQTKPQDRTDLLHRIQAKLIVHTWSTQNAVNHFRSKLKSNPDRLDLIYGLALAHYKSGNYKEAIREFNNALAINPNDSEILKELGICHFSEGRPEDAIPILERSVAIDEKDVSALFHLGRAYQENGNFREAIDVYEKVTKEDKNRVEVYYNLGLAYGGIELLGKAYQNFGTFYKLQHKFETALSHFEKALEYYTINTKERRDIQREIEEIKKKKPEKKNGRPIMKKMRPEIAPLKRFDRSFF